MNSKVVTPINDPLISLADTVMDAVAGDELSGLVSHPKPVDSGSEQWLDELADGLSSHGWMTLDVREQMGASLLQALAAEVEILHRTDAMQKAGIGRGNDLVRDRSVRRDKIAWLQGVTPAQSALFEFFDGLRLGLNRRLFLGLKRFETHYATYQPGDFYKKHLDSFQGRASRVVSLVLYLNDNWQAEDGGALQVFNRENEYEVCGQVLPEAGRMAVFLSEEVPHEVLPANRTRYSLACWFRQDEVPLPL